MRRLNFGLGKPGLATHILGNRIRDQILGSHDLLERLVSLCHPARQRHHGACTLRIDQLLDPHVGESNVLNLVGLVPGVVPQGSSDGSLTGKNVFAAGNYQIGGGAANQSATYLDGVPVNDTYGNIVALVPSQDTVSEFRVQTNNNSAEYGRYTGGVINMASRSGSNGSCASAAVAASASRVVS